MPTTARPPHTKPRATAPADTTPSRAHVGADAEGTDHSPTPDTIAQFAAQFPDHDANATEQGYATVEILHDLGVGTIGQFAGFLASIGQVSAEALVQVGARWGDEVVALYARVVRLQAISAASERGGARHKVGQSEENRRKMLITMVDDVRVVLIGLSCQLSWLRAAKAQSPRCQQRAAVLTEKIYAPLANRLGIMQLKWRLEDLAFRYQQPAAYRQLAQSLEHKRTAREQYITAFVAELDARLNTAGVPAEVVGRPKHIFSIWKKMYTKNLAFDQLSDLHAVRLLVADVEACYAVLSVVHQHWPHLAEQFSDYIAHPKPNGYQSLHTVIIGPQERRVEVQIRTHTMHATSEIGVAAHWRYKENAAADGHIDRKAIWLRQLLAWKAEVLDEGDRTDDGHNDGADDSANDSVNAKTSDPHDDPLAAPRVYVFTPKATVMDLPAGATPIDFAYAIHSDIGHQLRGATVNGKMVALTYRLQTGDQVQIQTVQSAAPSRDWLRAELGYVVTSRARNRISQWYKRADYQQHIAQGRAMLDKELHRLNLTELSYAKLNQPTHFHKVDDLLAALGAGDYKLSKLLQPHKPARTAPQPELTPADFVAKTRPRAVRARGNPFIIHGLDNLLTNIANCCSPVPGDGITGYITTGRGVSIHRETCHNIKKVPLARRDRLIAVSWGASPDALYTIHLHLTADPREGLLHAIAEALRAQKVEVLKVNMDTDAERSTYVGLQLQAPGELPAETLIKHLRQIEHVVAVRRV